MQRKREGDAQPGKGSSKKDDSHLPPEELEARRRREAAKARVEKRTLAAFGMG